MAQVTLAYLRRELPMVNVQRMADDARSLAGALDRLRRHFRTHDPVKLERELKQLVSAADELADDIARMMRDLGK